MNDTHVKKIVTAVAKQVRTDSKKDITAAVKELRTDTKKDITAAVKEMRVDTKQMVAEVREDSQRHMGSLMEFHRDEMKVMREYMDVRFEAVERDLAEVKTTLAQASSVLAALLQEFKTEKQKRADLEAEVSQLRSRLDAVESQLAAV